MHNAVQFLAVHSLLLTCPEDTSSQRRTVEWSSLSRWTIFETFTGRIRGGKEEIRRCRSECVDDAVVGPCAGFDCFARQEVGVYNGEGVRWGGEEVSGCGFAGCNGAGQAYEAHCERLRSLGEEDRGQSCVAQVEVLAHACRWDRSPLLIDSKLQIRQGITSKYHVKTTVQRYVQVLSIITVTRSAPAFQGPAIYSRK